MRDPITDAAQDPSCLLCLTPDRGGSWWSRLRPAMPRNFAANPMTFTDSYTAQDGIGTDDFTLSVDFTVLEKGVHGELRIGCMYCIYYDSTKGHQPCVWILKSDGTKSALYPVGTSHILENVASIKVIKTGQNVRMVVHARDGSTVKDQTKPLPDGATVTSLSGATTYPGNIFAASIRNDTTGTAVWQAAYSDLYDTSNPWPSPVPENFAEKGKAFYDCQAVVREELDPTHDYSFLIEAEIVRENPECSMFYAGGDKFPFGVYVYNDHTIRVFSNLLRSASDTSSKYVTVVAYSGDTRLQGRHTIESRVEGTAMRVFLDGNEIEHSYTFARTGTAAVGLPNCNSGYVYKIQITDLTDNQVVWSYPSEAERVRLITKTNVRTDRGAFEAADETQPARVDTALDLRGKVSSYTVVVDFEAAEFPETTTMECHQELAGQGGALIGSGTPPICSIGYYLASSGSARLQLSQEVAGGRHVVNATLTGRLSGRHICCGVVEVDPAAPLTASTLYLDGVRIGNASIYAVPTGNAAVSARCFSIAGHSFTGGWPPYTGKVYSGLLFDRALSAAEIAALTPKQA